MKAVAFDLDDTLLRDDLTISDYSVRILRRLHAAGIRIIPASGRARPSMQHYIGRLDCASLFIACNGAEIWDVSGCKLLSQELFSVDLAREIADFAEQRHCYAQVYQGECFYFNRQDEYAVRYARSASLKGVFAGDLRKFIRQPQAKILLMSDETTVSALLKEASQLFTGRASVTCSKPWFLEFNPLNATKGIALGKAAHLLNIEPSDVIAFGDSLNDLSMLQAAGISVAVANGREEIRSAADAVCGSNNEDGPAHYLQQYFFPGEAVI